MEHIEPGEWATSTTETIFENITTERRRQKLSAQELARRCEELGYPIDRRVLSKMDTKKRANISIPELIVIAESLRVPPISLIYSPFDAGKPVHRLPNAVTTGAQASEDFMSPRWGGADAPESSKIMGLLHICEAHVEEASITLRRLAELSAHFSEGYAEMLNEKLQSDLIQLADLRSELADAGVVLPPLPERIQRLMTAMTTQDREGVEP